MKTDVHLRLVVSRGIKSTPYQDPAFTISKPTIVVIPEYKQPQNSVYKKGLILKTVKTIRGPHNVQDPRINSLSKLNCIIACIEAKKQNADEALMFDINGNIATNNSTHFFYIKNKKHLSDEDMVAYQEEVRDPTRIVEVLNRVIMNAKRASAPAQINIPRDMWTQVIDIDLPAMVEFERPSGGDKAILEAAEMLSSATNPVILNGAGVVLSEGAVQASKALAERLDAAVCVGYQHNDAFPGSHPLFSGPLGYNGSKAAMELIKDADVVLCLGTRLNPFSTLPGYGIDYWPQNAKIIQVDINPDRIGLTKKVSVGIVGDAAKVADKILHELSDNAGDLNRTERKQKIAELKSRWAQQLSSMDHEEDDPGTTWNERARADKPDWMSPRKAWRAIQAALPKEAIISSDIGNNCAIGNAYPTFEETRKYLAPGLFGPCGYGLPSVVGAKIGRPDVPVVGFSGAVSYTHLTLPTILLV